ncbi:MAG: FAD-dependent oxidoreductase [Methylobacteriaceae bacterium]|jgi:2-polyprenyl-6-methoxyphenol hydroxylase-like FAD-dependent oxidoreductase|nr:FAD-dependent oxidoreductase [Methylobacteriaceae bacterium]
MAARSQEQNTLPVTYSVDVLVLGGGPAGVAAAVGAARAGMDVMMVERYGFCGGMTTAGMAGAICGLFTSSKTNKPEQLVHGFAGEFHHHLKTRGAVSEPYPFGDTRIVMHEPFVWKEIADALLLESGVTVLFHTFFSDVVMRDGRITAVVVENKNGRQLIEAKYFVDATGDGDVCFKAGVPCTFGKEGVVQYPTMVFRMNGVDVPNATSHPGHQVEEWVKAANGHGYHLPRSHIYILPSPRPGEILCNMTAVSREDKHPLYATRAEDMTWAEFEGRRQVREYERFLRDRVPGFENARLNDVAPQIGVRQSRTVTCRGKLMNQDVFSARKSERSVAKSAWCIEAHGADGIFMFYLQDDYYDIPYDTLVPAPVANLITAGRTLNAEHEALASARVTAQCFLMGYAAGNAAAIACRDDIGFAAVDVAELGPFIDYRM